MITYEAHQPLKHYLLKDVETGEYKVKSTTKCLDKYIMSKSTKISFDDGPVYQVIQQVTLD